MRSSLLFVLVGLCIGLHAAPTPLSSDSNDNAWSSIQASGSSRDVAVTPIDRRGFEPGSILARRPWLQDRGAAKSRAVGRDTSPKRSKAIKACAREASTPLTTSYNPEENDAKMTESNEVHTRNPLSEISLQSRPPSSVSKVNAANTTEDANDTTGSSPGEKGQSGATSSANQAQGDSKDQSQASGSHESTNVVGGQNGQDSQSSQAGSSADLDKSIQGAVAQIMSHGTKEGKLKVIASLPSGFDFSGLFGECLRTQCFG